MPFYVYAWTASILYTFAAIVGKFTGKYLIKNPWQFSFFWMLFSSVYAVFFGVVNGAGLPIHWGFILLSALFVALGNTTYVLAIQRLDVSVLSPLFNIRVVISVLLGVLFLGEPLTVFSALITGVIVIAGVFATMDEKFSVSSFLSKNVAVGLLLMVFLSLYGLFVNRSIAQTDYWTASMWISMIATVLMFVFLRPRFKRDVQNTPLSKYVGVFAMATFAGLGDLAANKAYSDNIGVSSIIISLPLSMIAVFLLSFVKPGLLEKHPLKVYVVRFLAAGVMIWGALQLSR